MSSGTLPVATRQFLRVSLALLAAMAVVLVGLGQSPARADVGSEFISVWNTENVSDGSSADNQVKLPLVVGGVYDFTVDWR